MLLVKLVVLLSCCQFTVEVIDSPTFTVEVLAAERPDSVITVQDADKAGQAALVFRDAKEVIQSESVVRGRRDAPVFSEKSLVELWTTANCPPCERMKKDIDGGCLYGASIVWNRGERPSRQNGFPQCRVNGVEFVGWSEQVKTDVRRAAGLGPTVKQSLRVAAPSHSEMKALHDRLHGGGSWTWPGDLRNHLETVHGVDLGQAIKTKPVQIQSRGSACPGGYCPQPQQRRGLFGRWRR